LTEQEQQAHRQKRAEQERPLTEAEEAALGQPGRWETAPEPDASGKPVRTWVASRWHTGYIGSMLRDRRVLGEFEPRRWSRIKEADEPIAGVYPVVVTESEWLAARAGVNQRQWTRGRAGEYINIFQGLLRDARTGDSYIATTRNDTAGKRRVLINTAHT